MTQNKSFNISLAITITIILFSTILIVGFSSYNKGLEDATQEMPSIGWSFQSLSLDSDTYNRSWYSADNMTGISSNIIPTISNESWIIYQQLSYNPKTSNATYCNMTLTIYPPPHMLYSGPSGTIIERILIFYKSHDSTNPTYALNKVFNIYSNDSFPAELNFTSSCQIIIWGYGHQNTTNSGNLFSATPVFTLSNFILFS